VTEYDAIVVGAGPNGLAAAAHLTRSGRKVLVVEQSDEIGGGTRTEPLTMPGYAHDVCSTIHPLGIASPFFNEIELDVEWVHPEIPIAHPLGGGRAAAAMSDLETTAADLGDDRSRYLSLIEPLVERSDDVIADFLRPLVGIPRNPSTFARMATRGSLPAGRVIDGFSTTEGRSLLAGIAAHAVAPFSTTLTGGVMMLFAMAAHSRGWPLVRGGSQQIAQALGDTVVAGGGAIEVSHEVTNLAELPPAAAYLLDLMPGAAARIAGERLDDWARRRCAKHKVGPAAFKVDWALDGPIPWQDPVSGRAGTVHLGGTYEEVRAAEDEVHNGSHPEQPFVLLAQQTLLDPLRAPSGRHTAWAYCHVPNGSTVDMTQRIEAQVERFAPGFIDLILARSTMSPAGLESHNPNYLGGDITGGGFGMRKVLGGKLGNPYRLGDGVYLCSSATPPGAGVHGMCGYNAAESALKRELA
jgi:phytoene dehydrogenase-like protein